MFLFCLVPLFPRAMCHEALQYLPQTFSEAECFRCPLAGLMEVLFEASAALDDGLPALHTHTYAQMFTPHTQLWNLASGRQSGITGLKTAGGVLSSLSESRHINGTPA